MVYFACTNKLNCSAERGDGGGLQFQLPCAWWSFTKNILNSFSRIHNDPRRSKVKYHEFWQLHWQRSWAQSEGPASVWRRDRESLSLSVSAYLTLTRCVQDPGSLSQITHLVSLSVQARIYFYVKLTYVQILQTERDLGKTRRSVLGSDCMTK